MTFSDLSLPNTALMFFLQYKDSNIDIRLIHSAANLTALFTKIRSKIIHTKSINTVPSITIKDIISYSLYASHSIIYKNISIEQILYEPNWTNFLNNNDNVIFIDIELHEVKNEFIQMFSTSKLISDILNKPENVPDGAVGTSYTESTNNKSAITFEQIINDINQRYL